jgi:hypothetical protein
MKNFAPWQVRREGWPWRHGSVAVHLLRGTLRGVAPLLRVVSLWRLLLLLGVAALLRPLGVALWVALLRLVALQGHNHRSNQLQEKAAHHSDIEGHDVCRRSACSILHATSSWAVEYQ